MSKPLALTFLALVLALPQATAAEAATEPLQATQLPGQAAQAAASLGLAAEEAAAALGSPWRQLRPAEPSEALASLAEDASYDLDMPWGEPSFEAFRASYLSPDGRRWLAAVIDRGSPYMAYVMQRIRFFGLPEELAFLPVVESEFSPRAVSRSGAAGMWQFMRNSIGGYGMRIDDWVDERRDFMKSTDAALRKLADNHALLGDWNLALAAYNMGLGAVSRAVAASGIHDFFRLREEGFLSRETSSYVPKFLAVASILRHPGRFGLPLDWKEPLEWEGVELDRSVDLGLLSEAAGIPVDRLRSANAELRYAVTPPWKGYRLKVPAGSASAVGLVLSDPSRKLLRYTLHTVRSGDSVSALSRAYGSPVSLVVEANPGLDPARIRIGQVLVIPVLKEGAVPPPPEIADDAAPFEGSYLVAKGDSLWGISLRFSVRPETLADRNGLELTSVLREGMRLSVPITKP